MTDLFDIPSNDSLFAGLEPALKVFYSDQQVRNQCYAEHPLLGLLEKKEDLKGMVYPVPLITSPETGASHDFGVAQATANSFTPNTFFVQVPNDYSVATISTKAMLASQSDAGAFLDLAKGKIDGAMAISTRRLSLGNYRNSTGIIGQIGSISTGVITLADRGQVVAFERGMKLSVTTSSAPTGTGDLRSTSVYGYVIAVDRAAGTITVSMTRTGSAETPTNWAANDYIIGAGDVALGWNGLDALIPSSTPAALWGVTRTTDRQRLAGTYIDRSTSTVQEALIDLGNSVCEAGVGRPSHVFMNYASFGALLKEVGAKTSNIKESAKGGKGETLTVSYEGLELYIPSGRVVVVPDRDCLPKQAFMLDMSKMKLLSMGPAIRVISNDGLKWLRQASADGAEIRIGGFANIITDSPGAHGRAALMF